MNQAKANKQAAKQSKTGALQYVVWVMDQGRDIYTAEQVKMYAAFICIEAVFLDGVQISAETQSA